MSEAQRFPDDYDGIVAGAPANNRIRQTFGFMWSWSATHRADGTPILDQASLAAVTNAVVAACDARDGLKDGLIDDPRRCVFDPATLACNGGTNGASCLTPEQVDAVQKVYDGAKNPRTGEQIFTGWPRGSEALRRQSHSKLAAVPHSRRRNRRGSACSDISCSTIRTGS